MRSPMDLCDDVVPGIGGNLQFVEIFEFGLWRYCFSSYRVSTLKSLNVKISDSRAGKSTTSTPAGGKGRTKVFRTPCLRPSMTSAVYRSISESVALV